ncbi:MAG TPA: TolC family protein [Methylomirabilota bacterium]|nr:TolC family protein [Methylomirabilota bacterium]
MRRLNPLLLLAMIAAPVAAPAQTPAPPMAARPITLEEAVAMAQRNALVVIQAHGQVRTSAASTRAAYGAFLPSVSLSAGANRSYSSGQTRIDSNGQVVTNPSFPWTSNAGLSANVTLFSGGQRIFDLRQARARETAADVNETTARFSAMLDAKQQYYNVLAARESQTAAAAQLDQAEQQRKTAIARSNARVATRSDSLRAEIQYRTAQLAVTDARNDLETANAALTRAVGSEEPVTAAAGLPEHAELALDDATLRAMALNGPAVRQAGAELSAAKSAQQSAWTHYLPALNASYSRTGSAAADNPEFVDKNFRYSGVLRFTASVPVFDQFQRELRVTQAKVDQTNAEASLRDARLAAVQTLTTQLGAFRSAQERVDSQIATVEAAEEDLRVQQQRYAVGASTLLDVLTSQTQLIQARRDLIRARYDQRIAKAQLEALVGREL